MPFSCGPKKNNSAVVEDLVYPSEGLFSTDYKYLFFGKIGYTERSFQEDTLVFPPIEGLIHKSAYAFCPTDTCFAEHAVLALRCPPIETLLNWVSDTVNTFAHECPIGNGLLTYNEKELSIPKKHFKSADAICDYYTGQLQHAYDNWHCTGEGDHNSLNEQAGLLIADCWSTGNLYTFYRIDWYDWMSCGNNARESWWTVDSSTGNLLSLNDLILPEKVDTLADMLMHRLVNGGGEYLIRQYDWKPEEYKGVLERANGCALIPEGMVFYYYPYNLGSGADGQYEAVIPYEMLGGILKETLSSALVPSPEDESIDVRKYVRKDKKSNIDLFGLELVGSPKHILRELSKNSYLQIDYGPEGFIHESENHFSCRVLLDGIPFGMNINYSKDGGEGVVTDVTFITGDTDHKIIETIVKKLTEYYGKPEIIDMPDEYYKWSPNQHFMQARPLHREDGGWTFYIL